jgi:hypothetical protein
VQVGSTEVLALADPGNFGMVVKDFDREEVNLTREQHAHQEGVNPVLVPIILPAPQRNGRFLSWLGFNLPAQPSPSSIIPNK